MATYYVNGRGATYTDPLGNVWGVGASGNNGAMATPMDTITHGIAKMTSAGDTLIVAPATYTENISVTGKSGDATHIYTVKCVDGDGPVVVVPASTRALDQQSPYWNWQRIIFDGQSLYAYELTRIYSATNIKFLASIFHHASPAQNNISFSGTTPAAELDGCLVTESGGNGIYLTTTGGVAKLRNTLVTGCKNYGVRIIAGATLDIDYSNVIGNNTTPSGNILNAGTIIDGGNNLTSPTTGLPLSTARNLPELISYAQPTPIFCLTYDDHGMDDGTIAQDASQPDNSWNSLATLLATHGLKGTFNCQQNGFVGDTGMSLPALSNYRTALQTLVAAGHEVGVHGYTHQDLSKTNGLCIYYNGANGTATASISGTTLTLVDSTTHTIDLTAPGTLANSPYIYMTDLINAINALTGWHSSRHADCNGNPEPVSLADRTSVNVKVAGPGVIFSFDTVRLTNAESQVTKNWLEQDQSGAGVNLGVGTVTTIAWPYTNSNATAQEQEQTIGFAGARGDTVNPVYLNSVPMFHLYHWINTSYRIIGDEVTTRGNIRHLIEFARGQALVIPIYGHSLATDNSGHTRADWDASWGWVMDELSQAQARGEIKVMTFGAAVANIVADHATADGGLTRTKTYSVTANYRLKSASPCIKAGTSISLTTDYTGWPITGDTGAWPIGPYAYRGAVGFK